MLDLFGYCVSYISNIKKQLYIPSTVNNEVKIAKQTHILISSPERVN